MKHFLFITLSLLDISLFAQNTATISGMVTEEATQNALPYVTIVINLPESENLVSGTITDENGQFILEGISSGSYDLAVSFIGYETIHKSILVGEQNSYYDLGRFELKNQSKLLDEVTISAKQAIVNTGLDKKRFSLSDQIAQSGGSVLDAMKAMPGISLDQEGHVLLRGSDKVAILLDGKQSGMTGYGNQKSLDNIPAGNIESIEIINNPSSKYDATGMAGIINIVYKKEREAGLNGDIGMAIGIGELTTRKQDLPTNLGSYKQNLKFIPSLNMNFRSDKFNSFLQSELLTQAKLPNNEFTTRSYADGANTISEVPENRKQNHYIVNGGLDYFINNHNTLSFSTLWDYEHHIDTAQVAYIDLLTNQRNRYWHWQEDEVTGFLNFNMNFEHKFQQPGHLFNISAQYSRGWEDESYFLNDSTSIRQAEDDTHIVATEHIYQFTTDYRKPLGSGRLELGSKLQFRSIPVTYDVVRGTQSIIYEGIGDWSDWGENIYAAYANYVREKIKYDIEGGIRLEHTSVYYDISPTNIYYPQNDAYNYLRAYPNIRFTYKPNLKNRLSLFYNQRVDRPGEPNLRIFPKYDDPELLKVGDPYVRPQFTQTFETSYKRLWTSGSIVISSYFRLIDAPFLRIYSIDESNPDYTIINKIYQNVGSGSNTGIEMLLAQKIDNNWQLSGSFNWYNNVIDAFTGTILFPYKRTFTINDTKDQTWDVKINNQITLSNKLEIQLTAIYMAPKNIPQGIRLSRSSIDLGIKKNIMNKHGELVFSFNDIFNGFGIREEIEESDFVAFYENYFETQVARLGFKYKW